MNDTIKILGSRLRDNYNGTISQPMDWRLIDVLCRLGEAETGETAEDARDGGETTLSATGSDQLREASGGLTRKKT